MSETYYRCKGCGEYDSIVEISLVPRTVIVRPPIEGFAEYGYENLYTDAETIIGYGCTNSSCEWWQGIYGSDGSITDGTLRILSAPASVEAIAEEIEDTGVNPEAGNPAFYYPIQ